MHDFDLLKAKRCKFNQLQTLIDLHHAHTVWVAFGITPGFTDFLLKDRAVIGCGGR